jgi:molybdate/tungstate transport system ATP-binding protein
MLILKDIYKKLGSFSLSGISLEVPEGTYYVLLGRSGSGKTQLLELIAGLTSPDSGQIWLDGVDITRRKLQERGIGLVFQDYAIFPNMTVHGNIAYSLESKKTGKKAIRDEVARIAAELNISHLLGRDTDHLSGGELQRVALARTLITSPRLLLLDEPMASIDASLKDDIKRLLRRLNGKGLTIIHVTHDYREAVSLALKVGVIHNGKIIQEGMPDDVFRRPVNKFVARYAGIRNFFRVEFSRENGHWKAVSENNLVIRMPDKEYSGNGIVIVRSDDIKVTMDYQEYGTLNCFKAVIKDIMPTEYGVEIEADAGEIFFIDVAADAFRQYPFDLFKEIWISFPPEVCIALEGSG